MPFIKATDRFISDRNLPRLTVAMYSQHGNKKRKWAKIAKNFVFLKLRRISISKNAKLPKYLILFINLYLWLPSHSPSYIREMMQNYVMIVANENQWSLATLLGKKCIIKLKYIVYNEVRSAIDLLRGGAFCSSS